MKKLLHFLFTLSSIHLLAQDSPTEQWISAEFIEFDSKATIKLDGLGNVYTITNQTDDNFFGGYSLIKYDTLGNQVWKRNYPPGLFGHGFTDLVVDSLGYAYVAIRFYNMPELDVDAKLIKYDPAGETVWENGNYRDGHNGDNYIFYLQQDSLGNLYALGRNDGEENIPDFFLFVSQIDTANGTELWRTTFPGAYFAHGMRIEKDWIEVLGSRYDSTQYYDIIQLNKAGDLMAFNSNSFTGHSPDFNFISSSQDIILGNRGRGYTTTKVSMTGDTLWRYELSDGPLGDKVLGITEDDSSNVYVAGAFIYPISNSDIVTTKFSKDGVLLWQSRYDYQENNGLDVGFDIYVDQEYAYVIGSSQLVEDEKALNSIIIYDKDNGAEMYEVNIERGPFHYGQKIIARGDKFYFLGLANLGIPNTAETVTGCFQMPNIVSTNNPEWVTQNISVWPNPCFHEIYLSNLDLQVFKTIELFDAQGRLLLSKSITTKQESLKLNDASEHGILILVLKGKGVSLTKKIVRQ